jgi:hypothetical protein
MKSANLISIYEVLRHGSPASISSYLSTYGISLKPQEIEGTIALINNLRKAHIQIYQTSGYFMSVTGSSGINTEFDILRYSNNAVINIEIKSTVPSGGFLTQMLNHHRILSLLKKQVYCYTYIEDTNTLYRLSNSIAIACSFSELVSRLQSDYLEKNEIENLDTSSLLISPYSQPKEFASHKYYLTPPQESIKHAIMKKPCKYTAIEGKAGSGKSLLLWDLAKEYGDQGLSVCIVFCANLSGISSIRSYTKLTLFQIKDFDWSTISNYDIILFDEAQRLWPINYDKVTEDKSSCQFIFAIDHQQTLAKEEIAWKIAERIKNLENCHLQKLPTSIRTNASIESFAKKLLCFNCRDWKPRNYNCIKANHFVDEELASKYLNMRLREGKKILELSSYQTVSTGIIKLPNLYLNSRTVHDVIGQEYDDVVIVINKYMAYALDASGNMMLTLNYSGYYPYDGNHGIWEIISRAKKSLELVVINNEDIFMKICSILQREVHN